jgi:hypothetical protein
MDMDMDMLKFHGSYPWRALEKSTSYSLLRYILGTIVIVFLQLPANSVGTVVSDIGFRILLSSNN